MDEPLIALLGSPDDDARFGFSPSKEFGIEPPSPAWGDFFQVRVLSYVDLGVAGVFSYADPCNAPQSAEQYRELGTAMEVPDSRDVETRNRRSRRRPN